MDESSVPARHLGLYRRAMSGKSRLAGVKAHCYMCMGWDDVHNSVRECTAKGCPLYPYRPVGRKKAQEGTIAVSKKVSKRRSSSDGQQEPGLEIPVDPTA